MKQILLKPSSMPLPYGLLMNYSLQVRVRREHRDYNFEYRAYKQHAEGAMKLWDDMKRMMMFYDRLPQHFNSSRVKRITHVLSSNPENISVIIFNTQLPHWFPELWELEDDLVQNAPVIIVLNYSDAALLQQRNMEHNPYQRVIVIQNFLDLQAPAWVDRTIDDIVHGMPASQGRHPTTYDHLKCWADILGLHVHSYWYLSRAVHSTLRDTIRYDAAFITQPFHHEAPRTTNRIPEPYEELIPQLQENSVTESDEQYDQMQDPEQPEIHNLDAN
ncbi:unnamed protein product [Orchesella dallaii]|uniref:Uncharacterized protein n=1 Tax=Orchesella dallaii TaxID=48710 RepID=A0ABP1RHL7_9HEXA